MGNIIKKIYYKFLHIKTKMRFIYKSNINIKEDGIIYYKALIKARKGKIDIGKNALIMEYANLSTNHGDIFIGDNCVIQPFAQLLAHGGYISIGNNTWINSFTQLQGYGGIEIGSNCGIAGHTMILAESHSYKSVDIPIMNQPLEKRKVIIEDNVWIGCNVTILGDVKIGHDSIIGSNSFVNKDVPPFAIAYGLPAKVVKMRK